MKKKHLNSLLCYYGLGNSNAFRCIPTYWLEIENRGEKQQNNNNNKNTNKQKH